MKLNSTQAVLKILSDGQWRTGWEIRDAVYLLTKKYYSESGITARVRELRSKKYGKWTIQWRINNGRHEYRLEKVK